MKRRGCRSQCARPAQSLGACELLGWVSAAALVLLSMCACRPRRAPTAPDVDGLARAQPGDTLTFAAVSTDPDGGLLSHLFCWGDTSSVAGSPYYASGVAVTRTYCCDEMGRCTVTVRLRNASLRESR